MAALIAVAAAISVLLSKTVGGAASSGTPAGAAAKPWQHHADPQPQRARVRAHAHRVMTAHPVEVAARARRNREGSPSGSSFRGNHRWCAASCALSLRRYRSRFAATALQVHVRGRLGEILPGPAAPSPDAATLCRPRKPASGRHIAATGHDWPLRRIRARPSAGDGLVAPRCTDPGGPGSRPVTLLPLAMTGYFGRFRPGPPGVTMAS
jgi:hypothetical protein